MTGTNGRRGKTNFRSRVFTLHRWLGLHISFFFIFIFLTGTILLISDEIDAVFHPNIWTSKATESTAASFGDIYDSVATEFPQSRIFVLERQPQPWLADRSYVTTGWGERIVVWTDPETAEVLDVTQARSFRSVLHDLHDSLLIPGRIGFVLVSATSLILLTILIAGLITYRRFWNGLFRWPDRTATLRIQRGAKHRIMAVWSVGFLLITAVTGSFFMLTGLGLDGTVPAFQTASLRAQTLPANLDGALIDRSQQVAIDVSGIRPVSLVLPRNRQSGIQFSGFTKDVGLFSGATSVSVDPTDLTVLGHVGPDQFRGNARLIPLMHALHFGIWADPYSRALWFGFGIIACLLATAGLRVAISRQDSSENAAKSGLFRAAIGRLGIFKWGYALAIIAVLGIAFLRFGPGSSPWRTLSPIGTASPLAKVQIRGPLRQGQPANLRVIVGQEPLQSLRILDAGEKELLNVGPASPQTIFEFNLMGHAAANTFSGILQTENAADHAVVYSLGKAFW